MKSADQIVQTVGGQRRGQTIKLLVHREEEDLETLGHAWPSPASRVLQDAMGRRTVQRAPLGFPRGPAARYAAAPAGIAAARWSIPTAAPWASTSPGRCGSPPTPCPPARCNRR